MCSYYLFENFFNYGANMRECRCKCMRIVNVERHAINIHSTQSNRDRDRAKEYRMRIDENKTSAALRILNEYKR